MQIQYLPTEHLGKTLQDRTAIFDLLCKNERGEQFLLEMQNMKQDYFVDRSIYYSSFLIQNQNERGDEWMFSLSAVYIIGILNFEPDFMIDTPSSISYNQLMDVQTHKILSDKLNIILVSLRKFSKAGGELQSEKDKWLYTLAHSKNLGNQLPKPLAQDKFFNNLLDTIKLNRLNKTDMETYISKEEMLKYHLSHMSEELAQVREQGVQQGLQRGMQQGLQQGRQEGMQHVQQERSQTALNALKEGLPMQVVSKITSLSVSEIEKLKSRM